MIKNGDLMVKLSFVITLTAILFTNQQPSFDFVRTETSKRNNIPPRSKGFQHGAHSSSHFSIL